MGNSATTALKVDDSLPAYQQQRLQQAVVEGENRIAALQPVAVACVALIGPTKPHFTAPYRARHQTPLGPKN